MEHGLSGLTSIAGLEVRVYAVEMVYVPQGDFNCAGKPTSNRTFMYGPTGTIGGNNGQFYAPGQNFPVINSKLSPSLYYAELNTGTTVLSSTTVRIKGDVGIDNRSNGSTVRCIKD